MVQQALSCGFGDPGQTKDLVVSVEKKKTQVLGFLNSDALNARHPSHYSVPAPTGHQNNALFALRSPFQGERNPFVTADESPLKNYFINL